jgi:hypothetical protein
MQMDIRIFASGLGIGIGVGFGLAKVIDVIVAFMKEG